MYKITSSEFLQYRSARQRLIELKRMHEKEMQFAYDGINPTITRIDYELGQMYAESVNPEEYAIYLVELEEKHKKQLSYWEERAEVFEQALIQLDEQERQEINSPSIRDKLIHIISAIVARRPNLRRSKKEHHNDVKRHDEEIDNMSDSELLEGYIDYVYDDRLQEKCNRLRHIHGMTLDEVGERLRITSSRAKEVLERIF